MEQPKWTIYIRTYAIMLIQMLTQTDAHNSSLIVLLLKHLALSVPHFLTLTHSGEKPKV